MINFPAARHDHQIVRPLNQITDVEELRQRAQLAEASARHWQEQVARLRARVAATLDGDNAEKLLREIEALERDAARAASATVPGHKSEKRGRADNVGRAAQKGHGPTPQPELPVVEEVHKLDEADCICPQCGKALKEWADHFEASEVIDVMVRQHVRKVHKRQKYSCACGHIETAEGPKKLIPQGRYSTEFALQVVTQKFLDHIPLERQVRMLEREGLTVTSQTLWDQEWALYEALKPALARLQEHQSHKRVRCGDETRWPVLGKHAKNWTMWCDASNDAVLYMILESRSRDDGKRLFANGNVLMVDGYGVYTSLAKEFPGLKLAHCWSHARRHFLEIETAFPTEVARFIELVGQLFHIEKTGPPEGLLHRRNTESRKVVDEIRRFLRETPALPQSGLRKAMGYVAERWTGLTRFLDDAEIPLSNNLAERSLRGPVVGRKNHYGSKSQRGTEAAALFYSLLESAKLCDVEPVEYLRRATAAALRGDTIPLPHEMNAPAA